MGVVNIYGHTHLNKVEHSELALTRVHTEYEIESGIMTVDEPEITSPKFTACVRTWNNYRTVHGVTYEDPSKKLQILSSLLETRW